MAIAFTTTAPGASADYMKYLYTQPLLTDRLGDPNFLDFSLIPVDGSFVKLGRGNYITLSTTTQGTWFTGYIQNEPTIEKLGTQAGVEVYGYKYQASGDEFVLNLKLIGVVPPFINKTQGQILKSLALLLAPTVSFDVSNVADGLLLARYIPDPTSKFSDIVKQFTDSGNFRFSCMNHVMYFVQQDAVATLTIDGNDKHFTSADLRLTRSVDAIVNDAIVLGDVGPNNYMTEYFVGDGVTARFPLVSSVFGVDSTLLLDDAFTSQDVDPNKWALFDNATNYLQLFNGYMNVLGGINNGTYTIHLDSVNQIPLEGYVRLTHGEYDFVSASDGVICGLWTGAVGPTFANCAYGIRVTKSGGNTVLQPMVNGTVDATQTKTLTSYLNRFVLRTVMTTQSQNRRSQAYSYTDSTGVVHQLAATALADVAQFQTFISEIDPTTGNLVGTTSWTSANVPLSSSQIYATYCPVLSNDLHCTFTGVTISSPMQASLGTLPRFVANKAYPLGMYVRPSALIGHYYKVTTAGTAAAEPTWPTGSGSTVGSGSVTFTEIGTAPLFNPLNVGQNEIDSFDGLAPVATIVDANQGVSTRSSKLGMSQYNYGDPALVFFTDVISTNTKIPAAGDFIKITYRRGAAAMARAQDRVSIVAESIAWGDDGLRSVVRSDISPSPRNDQECLIAAQAIVNDLGHQRWDGSYNGTNLYSFTGQPLSGTTLKFQNMNASYPASLKAEVIQEVRSVFVSTHPQEVFTYDLTFGSKDTLKKALDDFTKAVTPFQQDTIELSPAIDITGVATAFAPDILGATLNDWTTSVYNLQTNQAPPAGGGFEVRYTDESWGPDPGKNLIYRGTSQTFSVPRNYRGKLAFIRAYDVRNQLLFSENFTNAAWTKASVTVVNTQALNPDTNSSLISFATATATGTVTQVSQVASASKQAAFSVSINAAAGKTVTLTLKDGGGTTVATSTFNCLGIWQRFTVTGTAGAAAGNFSCVVTFNQTAVFRISRASLETGTATETVYAGTQSTVYGALSQYAAGVHVALPLIPSPPTGVITYDNPVAPIVTLTLPVVQQDLWGVEIRASDLVTVLSHVDLVDTQFVPAVTIKNNLFVVMTYNLYSYNLLGEFSAAQLITATNPMFSKQPAGQNLLANGGFEKNTYGIALNSLGVINQILADEWWVELI